jgi:3-oxoacyl-[acyl-carrier protein] reductase
MQHKDSVMTLHGKVALVAGSSRGIGRAIALRYAALGADIVINYAKDAAAAGEVEAAVSAAGAKAITVQADVSDVTEIEHLFTTALDAFGKIDIVVANAGIEKVNIPVVEVTEADFDLLFRINTKGPFFVMQSAARHIADASKSAPKYLVQVLAQEIGHRKVTVNSLVPGPIEGAGIFAGVSDDDPLQESPNGQRAHRHTRFPRGRRGHRRIPGQRQILLHHRRRNRHERRIQQLDTPANTPHRIRHDLQGGE